MGPATANATAQCQTNFWLCHGSIISLFGSLIIYFQKHHKFKTSPLDYQIGYGYKHRPRGALRVAQSRNVQTYSGVYLMGGAARLCFAGTFFVILLFEIVDFRKRSVGGGVFYGPAPNVLGFVFFPVDPALRGRQGRDVLVWLVDTSNY